MAGCCVLRRKEDARLGPDPAGTEKQHAKGKLTARERIELLLDEGTFHEIEPLRRHRATGFGLESSAVMESASFSSVTCMLPSRSVAAVTARYKVR